MSSILTDTTENSCIVLLFGNVSVLVNIVISKTAPKGGPPPPVNLRIVDFLARKASLGSGVDEELYLEIEKELVDTLRVILLSGPMVPGLSIDGRGMSLPNIRSFYPEVFEKSSFEDAQTMRTIVFLVNQFRQEC